MTTVVILFRPETWGEVRAFVPIGTCIWELALIASRHLYSGCAGDDPIAEELHLSCASQPLHPSASILDFDGVTYTVDWDVAAARRSWLGAARRGFDASPTHSLAAPSGLFPVSSSMGTAPFGFGHITPPQPAPPCQRLWPHRAASPIRRRDDRVLSPRRSAQRESPRRTTSSPHRRGYPANSPSRASPARLSAAEAVRCPSFVPAWGSPNVCGFCGLGARQHYVNLLAATFC